MKYNPQKIEKKWQKYWEAKKIYNVKDNPPAGGKGNYMLLTEFSYPSGNLHIGHWYAYSIPDILSRYLMMQGYNVLYPTGFDAFGLPAENAAIQRNIHPEKWTKQNIAYMTKQLKSMGATFDWSRKVSTIDPEYYKWTQWLFLQLYKKGLAYRAKTFVNWCPKDKTVLANEQVVDGRCHRCSTQVEQRELSQWLFKITEFADVLADDLKELDWQETAKLGQINWIGRSEGTVAEFKLENSEDSIEVFTTRSDTIFGVTYVVLAPEHPLVEKLKINVLNNDEVEKYIDKAKKKTELQRISEVKDKTGVPLTGINAINPISGERIPVWVADYVLARYGTGAVMAVPAHDERDNEFAKKYDLPIKVVIEPETGPILPNEENNERIVAIIEDPVTNKFLTLNWGHKLGGVLFVGGGREKDEDLVETALREIKEETGLMDLAYIAKTERMHHHYFAFSKNVARNIDVTGLHFRLNSKKKVEENLMHDEKGNFKLEWLTKDEVFQKMEDENHLLNFRRLILGEIYTGSGILTESDEFSGLKSSEAKKKITEHLIEKGLGNFQKTYRLHDWILSRQRYWGAPIPMIKCEKCGLTGQGYQPVPEKDLPVKLPPLKDFMPAEDGRSPLAKSEKWLKVRCPKCKEWAERETDTMDTFVDSSWYFMRYADPKNKKEFADKKKMKAWLPVPFYYGGAEHTTMHLLYARFITKALHSLGLVHFNEPFIKRRNRGIILGPDGQKMSKSRGNVVDPDTEVKNFGADAVRMYLAFMGPYEQGGPWNSDGTKGVYRFLNRAWDFVQKFDPKYKGKDIDAEKVLNRATKSIGADVEKGSFNTGVSELMKMLNGLEGKQLDRKQYEIFLKLFAPFAPHFAEELWFSVLKNPGRTGKKSIHLEDWPEYNPKLLEEEKVSLVVQINGKVRDTIEVERGLDENQARFLAMASDKIQKHISEEEIKKVIYIKDKLINLVKHDKI